MNTYIYQIPVEGEEPRFFEVEQNPEDAPLTHHPETGEAWGRVLLADGTPLTGGSCCEGGGCCGGEDAESCCGNDDSCCTEEKAGCCDEGSCC